MTTTYARHTHREVSLVSDLDLAAAAATSSLVETTAGRIASTPTVFVDPDDSIARAQSPR